MQTNPNPYHPPQVASERYEPPSPPQEKDDGELGVLLKTVKFVSVVLGGLMLLVMVVWWVIALLM